MFELSDKQRRVYLEFVVRLMLLAAVLAIVAVLLASLVRENPELDKVQVFSLAGMAPGQVRVLDWHGTRLLLVKRRRSQVQSLRALDAQVHDEWSKLKPLPAGVSYLHRGLLPAYLLVFARGEQCEVEWRDDSRGHAGFIEPCNGLQYDSAGRVLKASDKSGVAEHLRVPAHRIVGAKLLVGDEPG